MANRSWSLAGPLTGMVFVALVFAGMSIAGSPDVEPSDSSDAIARTFADRSDATTLGSLMTLLGLAFFFPFLAYLRHQLQQAEGDKGWLAAMAYGGGLVTAAMFLLILSVQMATASVSADVDQVVGKVFVVYMWSWISVMAPPMMALTFGTSLCIARYGALPRWTGWLGFLATVTLLAPWMGAPIALGWIGLLSVVLLVQELRGERATAPEPGNAPRLVPE